MKTLYSSDRYFQVWQYTVGHAQLLLRSNRTTPKPGPYPAGSAHWPTRLEVLFKGVRYIALPTHMHGLAIALLEDGDPLPPGGEPEFDDRCFRIGATGVVVALAIFAQETELDYDGPTLIDQSDPRRDDGRWGRWEAPVTTLYRPPRDR